MTMTSPDERSADPMDFSKLVPHDAEIVEVKRGRAPKPNPMAELYQQSLREGRQLGVDVTGPDDARRVVRHLRGYAMSVEMGVTVQIQRKKAKKKDPVEPIPYDRAADLIEPDEVVTVAFHAREERMS